MGKFRICLVVNTEDDNVLAFTDNERIKGILQPGVQMESYHLTHVVGDDPDAVG